MQSTESHYLYRREDFTELPITLNHLRIFLDFRNGFVEAVNRLHMTARQRLDQVVLDAKGLEILSVTWVDDGTPFPDAGADTPYSYDKEYSRLTVDLPGTCSTGESFSIQTRTRCYPSDHILEGIYKDATPPGAPQQYVSQCQQWGFQRIMPIFDDCRAKCTMRTTIEADARYTHLISNGNIDREMNPLGRPVSRTDDPDRQIITFDNPIPMAPYLFVVCVGTWDELIDSITYPSGRTVRLEYLVPPGRTDGARVPMEILKKAVLWIAETQDYEYTADTYRTICMTKSNFGGMENVGNTTIVTDAALIDEHTLDQSLMYAHAVIVHEFEHNQCGSETTMDTPFDVWLNEAYTVDVERAFVSQIFDPHWVRLAQMDSIRHPLLGPLAIEDSGRAGRIVRDAFNDPDELIDGVTYVKAAEVIRMLRLILGTEAFHQGRTLYFSRFKHANATTEDFFQCFEEVSGRSLDQFKRQWLYTIGYPGVVALSRHDPATAQLVVEIQQATTNGQPPFHFPIDVALVDEHGCTLPGTERTVEVTEAQATVVFEEISTPPAVVSLNRNASFYGTFEQTDATPQKLITQAKLDTNPFNRVEAMRRLTDRQRVGLLSDPDHRIDAKWISLFGDVLEDEQLSPGLKAYFLRVDEQPLDRAYATWFPELVAAREKLMMKLNEHHRQRLIAEFHALDTYTRRASPNEGIEERGLKGVLLDLIAIDDSPEAHRLIERHLRTAWNASDQVSALLALNRSSSAHRIGILDEFYQAWHGHLSGYANYLRVVGGGSSPDVFERMQLETTRPTFDPRQPTWTRALFLSMAANNKMVWTEAGIRWLTETVVWMSPINDYVASRLLNTFQQCRNMKPDLKTRVQAALYEILERVTADTSATVHGQATAYLG